MEAPDDASLKPICSKCGQKLTLIGSVPASNNRPITRLYKCLPCQVAVAIPPLN